MSMPTCDKMESIGGLADYVVGCERRLICFASGALTFVDFALCCPILASLDLDMEDMKSAFIVHACA